MHACARSPGASVANDKLPSAEQKAAPPLHRTNACVRQCTTIISDHMRSKALASRWLTCEARFDREIVNDPKKNPQRNCYAYMLVYMVYIYYTTYVHIYIRYTPRQRANYACMCTQTILHQYRVHVAMVTHVDWHPPTQSHHPICNAHQQYLPSTCARIKEIPHATRAAHASTHTILIDCMLYSNSQITSRAQRIA